MDALLYGVVIHITIGSQMHGRGTLLILALIVRYHLFVIKVVCIHNI